MEFIFTEDISHSTCVCVFYDSLNCYTMLGFFQLAHTYKGVSTSQVETASTMCDRANNAPKTTTTSAIPSLRN